MDELKKEIMTLLDNAEILIKAPPEFYKMKDKVALVIDEKAGIADDIISLFRSMIEDAEKWRNLGYETAYIKPENYDEIKADAERWRKVREIATRHGNGIPCSDCDMMATCNNKGGSVCYMARTVVAALERDGVKG